MENLQPDFDKYQDGLVPAIIQDITTRTVLMLGYMNRDAFRETKATGKVTFYSRSKKRLWTKGETSGHILKFVSSHIDCDRDALLIMACPSGPVCHTGTDTCFGIENRYQSFLSDLESVIEARISKPSDGSYVSRLYSKGINKLAQKVGEEAVELVIEAKDQDDGLFKSEAADLLFHYLILLQARGMRLKDIEQVLQSRDKKVS